jgi:hypothetical protein
MAVDQKKMQGNQSGMGGNFDMNSGYPVPNQTYNLMQALVSKCEAIEAYRKYSKDQGGEFFQKAMQQEWNEAQEIFNQLKGSLK